MSGSEGSISDQSKSSSSKSQKRQSRIMPIKSVPDMRFEQSFLASIRGFIHEEEEEEAQKKKKMSIVDQSENEDLIEKYFDPKRHDSLESVEEPKPAEIMASKSSTGEPELWLGRLRIEWFPLLYITVRDQLFSPIIQGAVFGVAGMAFGHLRSFLIARRRLSRATF